MSRTVRCDRREPEENEARGNPVPCYFVLEMMREAWVDNEHPRLVLRMVGVRLSRKEMAYVRKLPLFVWGVRAVD